MTSSGDRFDGVVVGDDRLRGGARLSLARRALPDSRQVARVFAAVAAAIGATILVGWALAMPLLTSWLPGLVQAKVNAAICLVLLGLSIAVHLTPLGRRHVWIEQAMAAVVAAIAVATLLEHVTGMNLRIDQLLVMDTASAASPHPGRFAVQTAVALLSAAIAVLVLGRCVRGVFLSELLALLCGGVGSISALGHLYGAPELLSLGSAAQVALPSAIAMILIGFALLGANPDHALVRQMADTGMSGQVMRRFVPAALLIVPVGAWVRLVGERAGLFDELVGLSIMVAFEALVLVAVGMWTTARVQSLEDQRLQALADLIRLGAAASTPLIETAPVGLAVLDQELRCLYVNPALAEMGGLSAVASLGQRVDRLMPVFGPEITDTLARVVSDGGPVREFEATGRTRGGRDGAWLLGAEALRDTAGDTVGLAISVVDITERKRREEALAEVAELQRQAHAIGESIPFGIWLAEPDGEMRYFSPSFLEMAGLTMEQARDSGWTSKLAPESAEQAVSDWQATVVARATWNHELVVVDTEDRRRTILSHGLPIRDESGEVTSWAGINLDITDRKDAEAFREAFLGILSHELGTPITSIYAASTLLLRSGLDDARRRELLGDVSHEAERLRRLIEDLVVLARAERGTLQVHTEPVLLQHLLPRVCDEEQRRWPDNQFRLMMEPLLPVARAEEGFVEQIVRNLLENAAKYGPSGGLIDLVADAPDGCPRVRVLDCGPGIDVSEAERLFEVFYRSERTSRVAGSGIGLFVAHRLVESIGGTIWARPRDDVQGAEFGFQLQPMPEDVA